MTVITTVGSAERHIAAERATLIARVSVSHHDRGTAMAEGTALHNRLAARAGELHASGDATWHHASTLSTGIRQWIDNDGSPHREHVASSSVQVKLSNLDRVAGTVEELSAMGASVHTSWALTEVTRMRVTREIRAAAVSDARVEADDFAAALGTTVARVATLRSGEAGPAPMGLRSAAMSAGESAEVSVPDITVRVEVTAEFETS
ncbi:SIMPL domain-containing protein [Microbacterium sp. SSW1-59]|uniref:SIMPL domain-containing protein n=1 Tax=Microbacterium xanthum TaxID=3079794 RepID=UPI002AD2CFBB|nr:SIMPL domain-containing protein [Microbacterium sp. SSW1-59]MDZ8201476.1 SIMPL domain-containing protein [Microbacterium sp. SSW1-59]